MTLIEKVARHFLSWSHEASAEEWTDYKDAAKAAIAVVLKDQRAWNIRVGWADRPIVDYARENGVSLSDD